MSNSAMLPSDKARDIRAMLKRGKTPDYVRRVFGWGPNTLTEFCAQHGIALPGVVAPSKASIREPKRAYASRDLGKVRSCTVSAVTTPELAAAVALEAERRNAAKGHILHLILATTHARGLWPMLLNEVSEVASASPMKTSEQQ